MFILMQHLSTYPFFQVHAPVQDADEEIFYEEIEEF